MALRMLSSAVAKRFPSYQHLVQVATFNIKHLVQGVGGLIQSELFFIELAKNKICQGEREREKEPERERAKENFWLALALQICLAHKALSSARSSATALHDFLQV